MLRNGQTALKNSGFHTGRFSKYVWSFLTLCMKVVNFVYLAKKGKMKNFKPSSKVWVGFSVVVIFWINEMAGISCAQYYLE